MMRPLISVIVPCYNQAQYLSEALQSVLEQSYSNWECIIVNDGSPDNTEEIANTWLAKDSRFQYVVKENGGLSSSRNAGIEMAKGEFILPLDADDKIGNQYLELAAKNFDNGYTIIYCQAEFFGNRNEKWDLSDYSYQKILFSNLIFCTSFFKKSDWKIVNGYDESLKCGREDWDFWLSILNAQSKVLRLDYSGFFYRRKENSMDVELNNDVESLINTENYIYIKHLKKYLFNNKNAIANAEYYFKREVQMNKFILISERNKFAIKILKRLRVLK